MYDNSGQPGGYTQLLFPAGRTFGGTAEFLVYANWWGPIGSSLTVMNLHF